MSAEFRIDPARYLRAFCCRGTAGRHDQVKSTSVLNRLLSPICFLLVATLQFLPAKTTSIDEVYSQYCPIDSSENHSTYTIYPNGDLFLEISYLQISSQTTQEGHPIAWIGSDGERNTIQAVDLVRGEIFRQFTLDVTKEGDWEAIGRGPCTEDTDGPTCLYFGNTGNNEARFCRNQNCTRGREVVEIYKVQEPDLLQFTRNSNVTIPVAKILIDYHHVDMPTNRADCEAIFVDPVGDYQGGKPGDLYLVTKSRADLQRLLKVPDEHKTMTSGEIKMFTAIPLAVPYNRGESQWSGADISESGTLIALTNGNQIKFFSRPPNMTVAEAISRAPCEFSSKTKRGRMAQQFESVAFYNGDVADASECKDSIQCSVTVFVHGLIFESTQTSNTRQGAFPTSSPSIRKPASFRPS